MRVFVDQAAQDGFSADPFATDVGSGDAAWAALVVGASPRIKHAIQELTAQGADKPLADRVHPRSPDGGAQDPGAGGLEDGVERAGEVRSAIADQERDVLEPLAEAEGLRGARSLPGL